MASYPNTKPVKKQTDAFRGAIRVAGGGATVEVGAVRVHAELRVGRYRAPSHATEDAESKPIAAPAGNRGF
jgi:hypothetical protein